MWVKSDNGSGGGLFEAQRNTGEQGISGQMYLSGGTVVLNLTASEGGWSTGVHLNSGEWAHLAWVIESGVGEKLYLDGSLAATNTPDHFDLDPTLFILGTKNISNYFNGDIDNVRIWNEARTQSEILNNMSLETPADTSDLIYECTLNGTQMQLLEVIRAMLEYCLTIQYNTTPTPGQVPGSRHRQQVKPKPLLRLHRAEHTTLLHR